MAQISKTPDKYYELLNGSVYESSGTPIELPIARRTGANREAGYMLLPYNGPFTPTVTACSITVSLTIGSVSTPWTMTSSVYAFDEPTEPTALIATVDEVMTQHDTTITKTFTFSGFSKRTEKISFRLGMSRDDNGLLALAPVTATATYTLPQFTIAPENPSYYVNTQGYLVFGGNVYARNNNITLQFTHNGQRVRSDITVQAPIAGDRVLFKVQPSWFSSVGFIGNYMQVDVLATDSYSRTATTQFTAVNPGKTTATTIRPKSQTVDGAAQILFAWNISDDWGTQSSAGLRWSTDQVTWNTLGYTGTEQTFTAPALKFPAGTIYWQVRVTNSYSVLGDWSTPVTSFSVAYSATSQVIQVNSQTSGIFARSQPMTFGAALEASGPVYTPFTFASVTFLRRAGTSGSWTSVAMSNYGTTAEVTIPANTFAAGVNQWQISATDNTGRTTTTPVYTITAVTSAIDVTPIRPVGTVESGSSSIVVTMSFLSLDGQPPNAVELGVSADGSTWTSEVYAVDVETQTSQVSVTVPPGTFAGGVAYWRARARNSAGSWGNWSSAVSFIVVAAPTVTSVIGDGKPFLTVSWQTPDQGSYGQQAYRVEVGGTIYGPFFGADTRSYTLKEALINGVYTIGVAVQNRFGIWSEWATGNINVANRQGAAFSLTASASGGLATLVLSGATIAPIITQQPQDYRASSTASFTVTYKTWGNYDPADPGMHGAWQYRTGPTAAWQTYAGGGENEDEFHIEPTVTSEMDGYQYRCRVYNALGEVYSRAATLSYGSPAGPVSNLQQGEWPAATGFFMIIRNSKLVGKTYENIFVDPGAIGTAIYEIRQIRPGGYFTRSTYIVRTVNVHVDYPTLIDMDTLAAVQLRDSESARRSMDVTRAREVAYTQYEGAVFPEAEIGEHESLSVNGDGAWTWEQTAEADAFEALLGRPVIYKTPTGFIAAGVLSGVTRRDSHFYRTARFSLTQSEWRDFRDET